jgi:hypothetical protein
LHVSLSESVESVDSVAINLTLTIFDASTISIRAAQFDLSTRRLDMTGNKPPVLQSAVRAYRDTAAAIVAMPSVALAVVTISVLYSMLDYFLSGLVGTDAEKGYGPVLTSAAVGVVWNFFLTPCFIAIHRFVVLGEVTARYELRPGEPRFLTFFGWTLFLLALVMLPTLLIPLSSRSSTGLPAIISALTIGFFFVSVRSIILFPAVAVDAPGATWSNAFADTRGRFWRITGILVLTMLPAMIVALILLFPTLPSVDDPDAEASLAQASVWASVVASALSGAVAALAVAAASRLYEALGDRVSRAT